MRRRPSVLSDAADSRQALVFFQRNGVCEFFGRDDDNEDIAGAQAVS